MIEPITTSMVELPALSGTEKNVAAPDFANWLGEQVGDINTQLMTAETGLAQLATGETGNLHHVMLELQKAKLDFQLALQIRNKVLEGYQDIMRMQI